jgi:hypothetical protein
MTSSGDQAASVRKLGLGIVFVIVGMAMILGHPTYGQGDIRNEPWALLVGFAVISPPVILGGRRLSAIDLLVLAAVVLGLGLLLRWRRTGSTRTLGSVLAIVGVVGTALAVGLIWLLVQGLGRPY